MRKSSTGTPDGNTFKDYLSTLSDDFFNFLFNVKRVTALSSKEEDKNLQKPTHQAKKNTLN